MSRRSSSWTSRSRFHGPARGLERHVAKLADVLRYVEDLCRFARESVSVLARSKQETSYREPTGSFDLRILPGGEARLATDLGYAQQVRTFKLDPRVWGMRP